MKYKILGDFSFTYKFWENIYVITSNSKWGQYTELQLADILQVSEETIDDIIANYQVEYVRVTKYKYQFGFRYARDANEVAQWLNDCLLIQKMI